jgi:hypothetical protein
VWRSLLTLPDTAESIEEKIMKRGNTSRILSWGLQGTAAVILTQTLFFKFSAAKESVYIFSTLGLEPWGRIGSGVIELIAAILLLIPRGLEVRNLL